MILCFYSILMCLCSTWARTWKWQSSCKSWIRIIDSTFLKLSVSLLSESSKTSPVKTPKKVKVENYKLSAEQKALIKSDKANKKLWDEAMQSLSLGPVSICLCVIKSSEFLSYVWGNDAYCLEWMLQWQSKKSFRFWNLFLGLHGIIVCVEN